MILFLIIVNLADTAYACLCRQPLLACLQEIAITLMLVWVTQLKVLRQSFLCNGKALSSELSCMPTGLG